MRALLGRGILVKSFIAEFLWNLLSRKKVVFVCEKLLVHVEDDGSDDNDNTFDEAVSKMKYKLMKSRRRPLAGRHLYCQLLWL